MICIDVGRQSICVHDRDNNAISISPLHVGYTSATRRTGSPLLSGTGGRVAPRPLPSNPGPRCVRRQRASRPVGTNGTCPPSAAPMAICGFLTTTRIPADVWACRLHVARGAPHLLDIAAPCRWSILGGQW